MERVNKLLFHPEYQKHLQCILDAEKTREYCRHNLDHFVDVARIGWIYCLENHLNYRRDIVYAMALMHDIGRSLQYTEGIPHDKASVMLCDKFLPECGFTEKEILMIQDAIGEHRQSSKSDMTDTISEDLLKEISKEIAEEKSTETSPRASAEEKSTETSPTTFAEMKKHTVTLNDILFYADHKSRKCFGCQAESTCYWPKEKKNMKL